MNDVEPRESGQLLPALAALVAACLPTLLAYQLSPSATLLNQCLAVAAWGSWVMVLAPRLRWRGAAPLLAALAVVAGAVLVSMTAGTLPRSLGLAALALLAAAAVMAAAGADVARRADVGELFALFCAGLLLAGVLGAAVAFVQVFAPGWTDGQWIAHSGLPGRAVGNLRQPNHLCSLLLWAVVAAVALHELRWLPRAAGWPTALLVAVLVFAVELTASRTGAAGLLLLLLWALVDRRLSTGARLMLGATPLIYALSYALMAVYGDFSHQALGAGARLGSEGLVEVGSANSRLNIWANTWALVVAQPWTGVGFGEFNIAWTLTPFVGRPTAFFDHSHNLPLQLAAELGLPLAALVLGLLAWALARGWRRATGQSGDAGTAGRAALVLVLLVGLHSLVEYPLWYAYFLLPAAFAWGLVLGLPSRSAASAGSPVGGGTAASLAGALAGALMLAGGALAVVDYLQVVVIYAPPPGSGSLQQRIARGQRSLLFAHHADYAAATNEMPAAARSLGFARAPHALLDTRLMIAWARQLNAQGHTDLARSLAQRLREFGSVDTEAQAFFAPCQGAAASAFQCQPAQVAHGWREFVAAARAR